MHDLGVLMTFAAGLAGAAVEDGLDPVAAAAQREAIRSRLYAAPPAG